MIIYFNLKDGYLDGYSSNPNGFEYEVEVSNDHEVLNNPEVFKFIDGELVKDEIYQQELIEKHERDQKKPASEDMIALALLELAAEIEKIKGEI